MGLTYKHATDISNNDTDITNLQNAKNFILIVSHGEASRVWTNQPAALTELFGAVEDRSQVDLTNITKYRLMVNLLVLNAENLARLGVQYSLDNGSNWFALDTGTADVISTSIADITTATGFNTHSWIDIATLAKADVMIRVVGLVSGGAGTGDPDFAKIEIQFK